MQTTGSGAGQQYLGIQYSLDGSSWTTTNISSQVFAFNNLQSINLTAMIPMAPNSFVQISYYNNSGQAVSNTTTANATWFSMSRVC